MNSYVFVFAIAVCDGDDNEEVCSVERKRISMRVMNVRNQAIFRATTDNPSLPGMITWYCTRNA